MNTNRLAGWLLMMGPIGMFSIWFILDPILIGEVADGLSPSEEAIAGLQLNLDKEIPSNILNLVGGFAFLGLFAGYTLLSRSLQGAGATYGTLCSLIFPVMIAIATVGFGLSVEAQMHLSEGYPEHAANLEIASNGMFGEYGHKHGYYCYAILVGLICFSSTTEFSICFKGTCQYFLSNSSVCCLL